MTGLRHDAARPLLGVRGLTKEFELQRSLGARMLRTPRRIVRAVSDVSFGIRRGETLGLIGESGCGKSTLARLLLRLHEPTRGEVVLDGTDVTALAGRELQRFRRRMQIMFQDPYASLNPRKTVEQIVAAPLRLHEGLSWNAARARVADFIGRVGLQPSQLQRYPHQFSGGQRQRIGIARALILQPEFVICDEPVSALDVSIQAQIVDLLLALKADLGLTYLFISHDLAVVGYLSDRIAVMYLGEIVEMAPARTLLEAPAHPYTQALLSAVPRLERAQRRTRVRLTGDLPSPLAPPAGCKFHTRCPHAMDLCRQQAPALATLADGHVVACHLYPGTR
ncbi:MAG TPA: dipeptide ABC transporter ATP-binding protein [Burkholderiaceae bacterium]|nr:dipeptide ABC transporter ATP-binding protein [Burkholderiaceae bacterium]